MNDNELVRAKVRAGAEKLILDRNKKYEYIVHYRMLK